MEEGRKVITESKGVIAMAMGIWGFVSHNISELIIVLIGLMVIDYITGITASIIDKSGLDSSKSLGNFSLEKGITGGIKKFCYLILIGLAIALDYVIFYIGTEAINLDLGAKGIFTLLVTCWLIATEGLSLVENLGRIGVPMPPFLRKAFSKLKDATEKVGDEE